MDEITSKLKPLSIKEEDKSEVNLNEKYTWDYDDDEMNDLCTVKLFVDNLINISEDSLRIQTANRKFNQFYSSYIYPLYIFKRSYFPTLVPFSRNTVKHQGKVI